MSEPLLRSERLRPGAWPVTVHGSAEFADAAQKAGLCGAHVAINFFEDPEKHDYGVVKGCPVALCPEVTAARDESKWVWTAVEEKMRAAGARSVRTINLPKIGNFPAIHGGIDEWLAAGGDQQKWAKLLRPTEKPPLQTECLADVQATPVRWLWPGRIARGKVSIIAGHPGLGKSQLTISLAAVVTTGRRWPAGHTEAEIGNVLFLSAEDGTADTIAPRLRAAGADLARCSCLQEGAGFSLKGDLHKLDEHLTISPTALLVIDPFAAYAAGVDTHRDGEVRPMMAQLESIAERHGCAVVGVMHLNKSAGGSALSRVGGSGAFVAAARGAYLVSKDQNDDLRRLFLPIKNNLAPDTAGLAFRVEGRELPDGIRTSLVVWESGTVDTTADEAIAAPTPDQGDRSAFKDAREFLSELLAKGTEVSQKQIDADAKAAGHSRRTVNRAKADLGVKSIKQTDGSWAWRMPYVQKGGTLGTLQ